MIIIKFKSENSILKSIFLCYLILNISIYNYYIHRKIKRENKITSYNLLNSSNYKNNRFIIIQHTCDTCGLFSFYKLSIGCIHEYLLNGYIPIIDMKSYPNIINGFDTSKNNLWEQFFEQPFGYNLSNVLKNIKGVEKINNTWENCHIWPDQRELPFPEPKRYYWHNFAKKFAPVKRELIDLSNKLMNNLFNQSTNILGVLARGTDYIAMKPSTHPIQPNINEIVKDVKYMDDKYVYDFIFFSSEDENYREKFTKTFPGKIKQIKSKVKIKYDYSKKQYLGFNQKINGNIEFNKIYLLNIIILSKCLDLIATKCNGSVGILILTNGFRNTKIYDLGLYH